jgi:ribosomal protein S18 acetylase RimI-like enzyme
MDRKFSACIQYTRRVQASAILRSRDAVSNVVIRSAAVTDFAPIARLVSDLGYPTAPNQMQRRLEAILDDHDYFTLVACDGEHVLGFVGARVGPLYEADGRYGQIMALAVAASHHRRGVGQMLMKAAESNLVERGARELVVTSGNHRAGAHAFYENCGYTFTGRRYKKSLATQPEPIEE